MLVMPARSIVLIYTPSSIKYKYIHGVKKDHLYYIVCMVLLLTLSEAYGALHQGLPTVNCSRAATQQPYSWCYYRRVN